MSKHVALRDRRLEGGVPSRANLDIINTDAATSLSAAVHAINVNAGSGSISIHALPDSPEFWAAYAAAAQGRPLPVLGKEQRGTRAAEGTLRWLCVANFAAPEYRRLDPTRK